MGHVECASILIQSLPVPFRSPLQDVKGALVRISRRFLAGLERNTCLAEFLCVLLLQILYRDTLPEYPYRYLLAGPFKRILVRIWFGALLLLSHESGANANVNKSSLPPKTNMLSTAEGGRRHESWSDNIEDWTQMASLTSCLAGAMAQDAGFESRPRLVS